MGSGTAILRCPCAQNIPYTALLYIALSLLVHLRCPCAQNIPYTALTMLLTTQKRGRPDLCLACPVQITTLIRVMAEAVSRWPVTAKARVSARGRQKGTVSWFSQSFSVYLCQCYSTVTLHTDLSSGGCSCSSETSFHSIYMNNKDCIADSSMINIIHKQFQGEIRNWYLRNTNQKL